MGQYWIIINLDKRQAYGHGKLGEWFFHNDLEDFMWQPKFPDRDTLVSAFKPGELFWEGSEDRPALYFPETAPRSSDAKALVNLPVEIIHEIFRLIGDLCDVVCLSMACQVLWEIGREHIYNHTAAVAADHSWGGDRLICVGDYLRNDDIPDNILTPAEREEFCPPESARSSPSSRSSTPTNTLYKYPWWSPTSRLAPSVLWHNSGIERRLSSDGLTRNAMEDLYHLRGELLSPYKRVEPVVRVLRNLSRRQYVTESALLDFQERYPYIRYKDAKVGFGEVLLTRICLSSDPGMNMPSEEVMYRGAWAGDRFDIVVEEWLKGLGDDEGWTDVSEEVFDLMEDICEELLS